MLVDKEIKINVISSVTISKLKSIGIESKINDIVIIPIECLWEHSNIKVNVICDICGFKKVIQYNLYNKNRKKYNIYCCSNKCSCVKNKLTNLKKYGDENYNNKEKRNKTNLEKYGTINILQSEEFKNKAKATKLERYGDENYNNIDKRNATNLERYGVVNVFDSLEIKNKTKKTNLEKYGCEDSRSSKVVINKRINTNLEKYGVEYYSKTKEYSDKVKNTSIERYGVDSPNKSEFIKNKKVKSMLNKYGFISNSCTEESKRKLKETNLEKYGVEYPMQVLEFFEKQQKSSKKVIYYNDNLYYQSSYEKHFLDYLNSMGMIDIVNRGPYLRYEFEKNSLSYFPDFYIDKYNLIIEIKSDYYYNKYINKNLAKMNKCIELGYNYLFIINKNYKIFENIINS